MGVKATTNEFIIGDGKQVRRARTIQRKPEEMRWDKDNLKMVAGVPWKNDEEEEEDEMDHEHLRDMTEEEKKEGNEEARGGEVDIPRKLYVKARDIETHGPTGGCQGCKSMANSRSRQAHTDSCRRRFEELLGEDDDRVKAAKLRADEYCAKQIEKEDQRRKERTN